MRERLYDVTDVGRLGSSDHVMISCSIVINDDDVDTAKTTINWRKADWNTTPAPPGATKGAGTSSGSDI
jgi:hypothetical protein